MSQLTKYSFDYCHFKVFTKLDNLKRYDMMTSISTFSLATACCYIDDESHLQDIIYFMTLEQQQAFKSLIDTIQQLPSSPELVIDVQQMIMNVFEQSGTAMSILATLADIIDISFSKGLNELINDKPSFTLDSQITHEFEALFSMDKLKAEMRHRKPKDMSILKALKALGPDRKLYYINKDIAKALSALTDSFPNFQRVIDQVSAACQVSALTNTPLSLPAMNLQGHPDIGKTQFVSALAKTLQLEFFSINAAAMTGRFELCGGNPQYGDTDLGAIGQIMCFEAKSFQPIILIDELCMAKDNPQDSIIQPLYAFFEREQRKSFKESFLNLELDLSGTIILLLPMILNH